MSLDFCRWEQAGLVFFAYTFVCALGLRGVNQAARAKVAIASIGALALVALSASLDDAVVWRGLLLPPVVLLVGYWTSGLLFRAPMPKVESFLMDMDRAIRIRETSAAVPRVTAEFLEFAYAAVYALIPIALAIHLTTAPLTMTGVDPFWTVILVTDFVCFGILPWIQSRPPRAIEYGEPWRSSFRRLNLKLLESTSIQVNTCPSGHTAEALAAALLVCHAPAPLCAAMLFAAAAVSAGAVYGRYHYAVDAVSGWTVALFAFAVFAS
jgi:membrane-associated phospholipid phosphatase